MLLNKNNWNHFLQIRFSHTNMPAAIFHSTSQWIVTPHARHGVVTWPFLKESAQANIKDDIKAQYTWFFVRRTQWRPGNSPHKVMKLCDWHRSEKQ